MILLRRAQFFFLYHRGQWSIRNATYFVEVIFTLSGTLKRPDLLSPHDFGPKHDSTTSLLMPQPCWDTVAIHQPLLRPSGPSRVAWNEIWNLVSIYSWTHCNCFCMRALFRGGWIVDFCTLANFWGILHFKIRGSRGTSSFKYCLLLCNGILALLILWNFLTKTLLIVPLSAQTKFFTVWGSHISFWENPMFSYLVYGSAQFQAFHQQIDPFSFPYCLKTVTCITMWSIVKLLFFLYRAHLAN